MARTFGVVAVLTVVSKFIGMFRDIVVAAAYGTSVVADAFQYASMFTGNVLVLFGGLGGPFHSSTVAVVTPQKDDRQSGGLVVQIMLLTVAALSVVTLLFYVFATPLSGLIGHFYNPDVPALGHTPAAQAAMTAMNDLLLPEKKSLFEHQFHDQLLWMLPLIVIAGIVGVSYGILNVYNKIFWPSLSPAIASIAIIIFVKMADPSKFLIYGIPLAVGTLAGAIGQMLAQFPDMLKLPLHWRLPLRPEPGLRDYGGMLWPAFISTSVGTLTVYVDMFFTLSTHTQGAWVAVVMSNRIVQLPLGILLTAMLVPILPRFTEQVTANKPEELKFEMRRALNFLWFISLPIAGIFFILPRPIVAVLFQRGNFDNQSVDLVTLAFVFLVPSIVLYVGRDLVTRVFYAHKDSSTPYKIAIIAIFVKAFLDWMLLRPEFMNGSVAAISLATTIMTVFNFSLLTWALKRKIGNLGMTKMLKPFFVMVIGSAICAMLTYGLYGSLEPFARGAHYMVHGIDLARLTFLGLSSLLGIAVYVGICLLFRLEEPVMFARRVPGLRNYVAALE